MRDILIHAIKEAMRAHLIASNRPIRSGFTLKVHPGTTYHLANTPEWHIDFDSENLTKYWMDAEIVEDVEMKVGHFRLDVKQPY